MNLYFCGQREIMDPERAKEAKVERMVERRLMKQNKALEQPF